LGKWNEILTNTYPGDDYRTPKKLICTMQEGIAFIRKNNIKRKPRKSEKALYLNERTTQIWKLYAAIYTHPTSVIAQYCHSVVSGELPPRST